MIKPEPEGTGGVQRRPRVKQRVGPYNDCIRCGAPVRRLSGRPFWSTDYCSYAQCQFQGEQTQQLHERQRRRRLLRQQELDQLKQRHKQERRDWTKRALEQEQQHRQALQLERQHQEMRQQLNVAKVGWPRAGGGGSSAQAHILDAAQRKRTRTDEDRHVPDWRGQCRMGGSP